MEQEQIILHTAEDMYCECNRCKADREEQITENMNCDWVYENMKDEINGVPN